MLAVCIAGAHTRPCPPLQDVLTKGFLGANDTLELEVEMSLPAEHCVPVSGVARREAGSRAGAGRGRGKDAARSGQHLLETDLAAPRLHHKGGGKEGGSLQQPAAAGSAGAEKLKPSAGERARPVPPFTQAITSRATRLALLCTWLASGTMPRLSCALLWLQA